MTQGSDDRGLGTKSNIAWGKLPAEIKETKNTDPTMTDKEWKEEEKERVMYYAKIAIAKKILLVIKMALLIIIKMAIIIIKTTCVITKATLMDSKISGMEPTRLNGICQRAKVKVED